MTTSEKKKKTQTSKGKKETATDQIDEYNFFVFIQGTDEDSTKIENSSCEISENGIIESKKSIDFFLPE